MCGIAGIISPDPSKVSPEILQRMSVALTHRGPDGDGVWIHDAGDKHVGFAHRRLAILDLSPAAAQPMHFRERYTIVHNGEIYNHEELREELTRLGHVFRTTSDTEVITLMLAAAGGRTWEERVERTLPAWKGAYSLVMLVADRVVAVRDPWGFRPLSVGRLPHGGYAVASETCALNTLGCVEIDEIGRAHV